MAAGMAWKSTGLAFLIVIGSSCADTVGVSGVNGGSILPAATVLAAVSPTRGTAVVGSSVEDLPAVIAQDANGNPVPNISVTFTQTKGTGVITGGVVMTNAAGIAKPERWTLGVKPGANVVTASAGSLGAPTFTITAFAGPPASFLKIAGDNQIAAAGTAPVIDPAILLIDAYGNGIGGETASFSVSAGGGAVSTSAVPTDSLGRASVRWRLGERGGQSILVSVPNFSPVTFTAIALDASSPCGRTTGSPLMTTEHSVLTTQSCTTSDGRAFETFPVLLLAGTYLFNLASNDFDTELEIRDENMNLVAANNDARGAGTNSAIKIVAAKGLYTIVARSHASNQRGAFTLGYKAAGPVSNCEEAYVTRGIASEHSVESSDCARSQTESEGRFRIFLKAGESVFVKLEDKSYSGPGLEMTDPDGRLTGVGIHRTAYESDITLIPPADGFYTVVIWGLRDESSQVLLTIR